MKRIFLIGLTLSLLVWPMFSLGADKVSIIHDISVSTTNTNPVLIPNWAKYIGVMIPSIDDGAAGIEVYESGTTHYNDIASSALLASATTNWNPILDLSDGEDAVICASTYDPAYVDITPFLGALRNVYIRFVVGTQTSGDTTWYIYFKD